MTISRPLPALCLVVLASALPVAAQAPPFDQTEVSAPGTTSPLLMTATDWRWEDFSAFGALTYNVNRRLPGDDFRCIQANLTSPSWTGDPQEPAPGEVYFYTVDADDGWGENRHGSSLPLTERCPCSGAPPVTGTNLGLELIQSGFNLPVHLASPPGDPARLFVVEKRGRIRVIERGNTLPALFLDLTSVVDCCGGSCGTNCEQGLLSLAFHPDYATNGRFFVYYTGNPDGGSVVEEYSVSADPNVANTSPVQTILTQPQFAGNHNGGQIAFGPHDGMLYIGFGDGGGANDPLDAGQDLSTWLGKIIRVDVDSGAPYAVPADNPFVGVAGALEEIWALGLRNPWRFTLDSMTGDLFIGDVGQNCFEEVSVGLAARGGGENYAWDLMEADHCFDDTQPNRCRDDCAACPSVTGAGLTCADLTHPVVEIDQATLGACSVIGGYVYRGCRLPDLRGTYFYSDYCGRWVHSFELDPGPPTAALNPLDWSSSMPEVNAPASFGQDQRGEIYIVNLSGEIYRVVPN